MSSFRITQSWFKLIAPLVLLLVIAVACGDDPTPTSAPTNTPIPQATDTPVPQPTDPPPPDATDTPVPAATSIPTAMPQPTARPEVMGKYGGVIPIHAFTGPSAAPLNAGNLSITTHSASLYSTLTEINPEVPEFWVVRGDLAKDWTLASDGVTYTFELNENATWHDGQPVTAEDVALSIQLMGKPDTVSAEAYPALVEATKGRRANSNVMWLYYDSTRAIDQNTVEIKTQFPTDAFLVSLGFEDIPILPKHLLDQNMVISFKDTEAIIGSGPFKLVRHQEGVLTESERNQDYFKEGLPYLDGLVHHIITDTGSIIAAYKTGQVLMGGSLISNLSVRDAIQLEREIGDSLTINWVPTPVALGVEMNTRVEPFDDPRARRAMNLALHRQPVIETRCSGQCPLGTPFPQDLWWSYSAEEASKMPGFRELDGEKHPDDIAEARRLMDEAGAGPGTKLELSCSVTLALCDLAVLIKEQLRISLEWDITIRQRDPAVQNEAFREGDFQFAATAVAVQNYDADGAANTYAEGGGQYYVHTGFFNPDAQPLWGQVLRESDRSKRQELMAQAHEFLLEDNAFPFLYYQTEIVPVDKRIHNWNTPSYYSDHKKHEHLWCDPEC